MTEEQRSQHPPCVPPGIDPQRLLQALTTEHVTLQTARSAAIADRNGRSARYLSTVTGAVAASRPRPVARRSPAGRRPDPMNLR
jgi:hypothetical protein